MTLKKPRSVELSPFRSAKWDELIEGRNFQPAQIPQLTLLVQWYEVIEKCMDDLTDGGEIQVAYANNIGDVKALPQLSTMKQASAEIRALNKQLGINDEVTTEEKPRGAVPLYVIQGNRQNRQSRAAN